MNGLRRLSNDEESSPGYSYFDLLIIALTEHEKNLNELIERLERVTEKLLKLITAESTEPIEPSVEKETGLDEENEETLIRIARDILQRE
jgi:hypothetical protein